MQRVALAVMRLQPLHRGHEMIIERMLQEADVAIVAIGSIQAHDTRNPYSFEQRQAMLRARFGDRVRVVGLRDIGAQSAKEWAGYVLHTIRQAGLPEPTHYYCGRADAHWFEGILPLRCFDRTREGEGISATAIRADLKAGRSVAERVSAPVRELIKEYEDGT